MSLSLLLVYAILPVVMSLYLLWRTLGGWSVIKQNTKVARFGAHALALIPLLIGSNAVTLALALNDPFYVLPALVLGVVTWGLVFFIIYKNTTYTSADDTPMDGAKFSPTLTVSKGAKS